MGWILITSLYSRDTGLPLGWIEAEVGREKREEKTEGGSKGGRKSEMTQGETEGRRDEKTEGGKKEE